MNNNADNMQYYALGRNLFAKGYAYTDYENDNLDFDNMERCPLCGSNLSGAVPKHPYQVRLSTKKMIGDFAFGLFQKIVVSANFKEKYEKSRLTGIKEFTKIQRVRVRKEILNIELYAISLERVDVRPEGIILGEPIENNRPICKLCNPYCRYESGEIGLIMNLNTQKSTPDIFLTYINCNTAYCNQRFVDFCHENKFINFDNHICKFEDYTSGIFGKESKEVIEYMANKEYYINGAYDKSTK